jgi:hypothetical protein
LRLTRKWALNRFEKKRCSNKWRNQVKYCLSVSIRFSVISLCFSFFLLLGAYLSLTLSIYVSLSLTQCLSFCHSLNLEGYTSYLSFFKCLNCFLFRLSSFTI